MNAHHPTPADHPASAPERLAVPVVGGELACHAWAVRPSEQPQGPPVIALHGITANGRNFDALARAIGDTASLYAPDLRGRAGSAHLPGPYGLERHVADVVALLDHLQQPTAVLLGHSMGAFVAALAAARHPERFPRVVLVDGGVGFPPPAGTDVDAQLDALLGPAMQRLKMTFSSQESYLDFFRNHPALATHWGPDIAGYVEHDLVGVPPALRSSCVLDAVRTDGGDVLAHPEVLAAAHQPQVRGTLLWAERGLLDQGQALYDSDRVAAAQLDSERLAHRRVDDTNHYTILFAPNALDALTDELRAAREAV